MCHECPYICMNLKWGCHGVAELMSCQGGPFTVNLLQHEPSTEAPAEPAIPFKVTAVSLLSSLKNCGTMRILSQYRVFQVSCHLRQHRVGMDWAQDQKLIWLWVIDGMPSPTRPPGKHMCTAICLDKYNLFKNLYWGFKNNMCNILVHGNCKWCIKYWRHKL